MEMMKAIQVAAKGKPMELVKIPVPQPGLCRTDLAKTTETVIIPVSSALRYNPVFPVRPFGENVRTYVGNRG